MRRDVIAFAMVAAMSVGSAVRADEPVVVELFTSQGCSSCPPADALFAKLAERSDLIPLALHVDYWDYIGWADAFANPDHTRRQKKYARAHGVRTIYTPQMVIGGQLAVVGHRPMDVADAILEVKQQPQKIRLDVTRLGDGIEVRVTAIRPVGGEALLQLVRYKPEEKVAIDRGENAGHTFTYHNIVTDWQTLATWNGRDPLAVRHRVAGKDAAVVLVQEIGYGPILAAARAP